MARRGAGPSEGEVAASPGLRSRLIRALVEGMTWWVGRMPLSLSAGLGRAFGLVWARLSAPRTRRVRDQMGRAFPDRSREEIETWTRGVFAHLASALVELIALRGRRAGELLRSVEVEGLEHLRAAEAGSATGGVLVVTGHIGNWELACAKVASLGIPVSVVYRGLSEPALDEILLELRGRPWSEISSGGAIAEGSAGASTSGVQQIRMGHAGLPLVRALEAGRKVITLLDQDAKREEGVFVSFFDRPASTRSGPIELAMARNVPIVPAFIHRREGGHGHRIEIRPALRLETSAEGRPQPGETSGNQSPSGTEGEAIRANTQRVTQALEGAIRSAPSQWIWTHRRWRTQPRSESPESEGSK